MAKAVEFKMPDWGWPALFVVAVVALVAWEKHRNPRCKHCGVALQVIEAGSKYLCPQCGTVATLAELVFGLA
jgi:tRNA(Ile2) C34 agmatinyltransferase TiaS